MNSVRCGAGKDTVKTVVPEEGSFTFADAYAIPSTVDNVDTAHAWINQVLDPQVNAEAADLPRRRRDRRGCAAAARRGDRSAVRLLGRRAFFAWRLSTTTRRSSRTSTVTIGAVAGRWQEIKAGAA